IPLTTDYEENSKASRKSIEETYQQIIDDLTRSRSLLSDMYRDGNRTSINRLVATALLSRVYLYREDWKNSEAMATEVINTNSLYKLSDNLDNVFLANSEEAIWQISPVGSNGATYEGAAFIITSINWFLNPVTISNGLMEAFEDNDIRKDYWVSSIGEGAEKTFYPFKYKISYTINDPSEFSTVIRLAELYLIRAETRAQLGNISGAQDDINVIRERAGIPDTKADSRDELLEAILQERRVELFTEQGHRWFDLVRTGKASEVL